MEYARKCMDPGSGAAAKKAPGHSKRSHSLTVAKKKERALVRE